MQAGRRHPLQPDRAAADEHRDASDPRRRPPRPPDRRGGHRRRPRPRRAHRAGDGGDPVSTSTWTADDIPDLHGRRALVTGVTGDLGRETARELARAGAHVTLAARDETRLAEVARRLADEQPGAGLDTVRLDLADLYSVRQ